MPRAARAYVCRCSTPRDASRLDDDTVPGVRHAPRDSFRSLKATNDDDDDDDVVVVNVIIIARIIVHV